MTFPLQAVGNCKRAVRDAMRNPSELHCCFGAFGTAENSERASASAALITCAMELARCYVGCCLSTTTEELRALVL
jgi:hypothetical protein